MAACAKSTKTQLEHGDGEEEEDGDGDGRWECFFQRMRHREDGGNQTQSEWLGFLFSPTPPSPCFGASNKLIKRPKNVFRPKTCIQATQLNWCPKMKTLTQRVNPDPTRPNPIFFGFFGFG